MNSKSEERPKIAVIGGGAAGFFGAIQIASEGICEVTLLEKGKQFLTKVKYRAEEDVTLRIIALIPKL